MLPDFATRSFLDPFKFLTGEENPLICPTLECRGRFKTHPRYDWLSPMVLELIAAKIHKMPKSGNIGCYKYLDAIKTHNFLESSHYEDGPYVLSAVGHCIHVHLSLTNSSIFDRKYGLQTIGVTEASQMGSCSHYSRQTFLSLLFQKCSYVRTVFSVFRWGDTFRTQTQSLDCPLKIWVYPCSHAPLIFVTLFGRKCQASKFATQNNGLKEYVSAVEMKRLATPIHRKSLNEKV